MAPKIGSREGKVPRQTDQMATWTSFPDAPSGDFARLIPLSTQARCCFQDVAYRMSLDPSFQPYSAPFVHVELASFPEDDPSIHSTPGRNDNEEKSWSSDQTIPDEEQSKYLRGFYRLNMLDPKPTNVGLGWSLGCGRSDREVEILLTQDSTRGVAGRHCLIRRTTSGAIVVVATHHRVFVDSNLLRRESKDDSEPKENYQRALSSRSLITIADLTYVLEVQSLSHEEDSLQMAAAFQELLNSSELPLVLLTPTPSSTGHTIGGYHLTPPFAAGVSSSVHYATHIATGVAYAVKKMKETESSRRAIDHEIGMLRSISHPRISTLVEVFSSNFVLPSSTASSPPKYSEIFLVLSPAAPRVLSSYTASISRASTSTTSTCTDLSIWSVAELSSIAFARAAIQQIASALRYLHSMTPTPVLHLDIKPDNIGLVSISPLSLVLLDFGHSLRAHSSTDHMRGTVRYLAPEIMALKQGRSARPFHAAVDVWALGLVVLETLFRQRLDESTAGFKRLMFRFQEMLAATRLRRKDGVDDASWWLEVVEQMLEKDPLKRITAKAVCEKLGVDSAEIRQPDDENTTDVEGKRFDRRIRLTSVRR